MRKNKGFTLGELLVVVAILGILTSVSIPIFSGKLSETEETVCLTNQASLKHVLVIQQMFSFDTDLKAYYNQIEDEYKCPSKNGQITCNISGDSIFISCTKHGEADPYKIFNAALNKLNELDTYFDNANGNKRIDSNATGDGRHGATETFKEYIKGTALDSLDINSWVVLRNKGTYIYVWSEVDVSDTDKRYPQIPAIGYDEKTGSYIVGLTSVAKNNGYNIIAPGAQNDGRFNPTGGKSFASLSEAQTKYNELMEEYNK